MDYPLVPSVEYGPFPPSSPWRPEHHTGCCDMEHGCGEEFGCDCLACEWFEINCCCECSCGTPPKVHAAATG